MASAYYYCLYGTLPTWLGVCLASIPLPRVGRHVWLFPQSNLLPPSGDYGAYASMGREGGSQMPVASWRRDLGAKSDADAKEMKLENLKHVVLVPLEINLYANQVRSATHHLLGLR